MKHIVACGALCVVTLLGGCVGAPIYRGLDAATGDFVSTSSPTVSVKAAEGYANVLSGYTLCRVPYENSFMNCVSANVWFSLQEREGSQLAVMLAECPTGLIWEVRAVGVEYQKLKVFYESNGVGPNDATVRVYVRPASMDPWTPLFLGAGKTAWKGDTLVARYEWTSTTQKDKLVVEYREPAPELLAGMNPRVTDISAFIARSQKAFTLEGVTEPVSPVARVGVGISDSLLAPVVGSVSTNQIILF